MAKPSTPLPIPPVAQQNVINYLKSAMTLYGGSFNIRSQLEARDRAYYREEDTTETHLRAKQANLAGDATKIQNVTVPVVMPQVETALGQYAEIFLTGYPIFGVVAPPDQADAIESMEAIIADNSIRGCWVSELMKTIRNGLKYDLGAIEVVWEKKKTFNIGTPQLANLSRGEVSESIYEGNFMYDRSPYNLILDVRVSPDRNHIEGEYAGYTEMLSRIATKQRMDDLDPLGTMNFKAAWESGTPESSTSSDPAGNFYTPNINPNALLPNTANLQFSWMNWVGLEGNNGADAIKYKDQYEWTVMYCRIIPKEFGINVQDRTHIQIWKFIVINRQIVIFAEMQTNAHNFLPIIVCKPSNDGLGYQSKSFAENVTSVQQISSSLVNSGLSSQRRKVYDRIFYDPTKIRKQDIDNTSPVARIPVKNSAMGKGIADAVYVSPYRDDGAMETFQMSQQIVGMGDIINGVNRVSQGQFQKGNKTRTEFETTMGNSNVRQRMGAMALELTFFSPIKDIIKANILQYQPPVTLVSNKPDGASKTVEVDPSKLREAMVSFRLSDGLLPSDKLMDTSMMQVLWNAAGFMPEIRVKYDLMGMLAYQLKLQGGGWMSQFQRSEEQQAQQLAQMQAAAQASDPAGTGKAQAAQQTAQAATQQGAQR